MFIWLMGFSITFFHNLPDNRDLDFLITVNEKPHSSSTLFDLNGPMESFLTEHFVLNSGGQRPTLDRFHEFIFGKKGLAFRYEPATRTPAESFLNRSGNCISLTLLVAAFASKLGYRVRFRQVLSRERARGMAVSNKWWRPDHVQIQVTTGGRSRTFDISPHKTSPHVRFKDLEKKQVSALYWGNLAVASHGEGRSQRALLHLKKALELDPGSAILWNNLGAVSRQMQRYREAHQAFQRAITLSASFKAPVENMALLYFFTHRIGDAADTFDTISKRHNPYSMILQGLKARGLNNRRKADQWFQKAVKLLPQSTRIHEAVYGLSNGNSEFLPNKKSSD